jgi:hypothetical protein
LIIYFIAGIIIYGVREKLFLEGLVDGFGDQKRIIMDLGKV